PGDRSDGTTTADASDATARDTGRADGAGDGSLEAEAGPLCGPWEGGGPAGGWPDAALDAAACLGQFREPIVDPSVDDSRSMTVADFNRDGRSDLAFTGSDKVGVLLGNGDGSLKAPRLYLVRNAEVVAPADFNGDGVPDLGIRCMNRVWRSGRDARTIAA
ncbi:MAG TPA: VCBS repeat-containing protein, partial [Casimicrobiaceae bacterium]